MRIPPPIPEPTGAGAPSAFRWNFVSAIGVSWLLVAVMIALHCSPLTFGLAAGPCIIGAAWPLVAGNPRRQRRQMRAVIVLAGLLWTVGFLEWHFQREFLPRLNPIAAARLSPFARARAWCKIFLR